MSSDTDALEAEREFLLRSLDDLDAEREAGNIDDDTYRLLHDDYTARAAKVIRTLDGDEPAPPAAAKPNVSSSTRLLQWTVAAMVVVFACSAAFLLTRAVGTREPGQTATGNSQSESEPDPLDALATAAAERPDDYEARISYARALLGTDRAAALREYDAAAALDPTQPEPVTYAAWIIGLAAQGLEASDDRDLLVERSVARFDEAVAIDPEYADTYVFRGIIRLNVLGDAAGAVPDFDRFLELAPEDHPMRETVQTTRLRAIEESEAASTSTSPTTTGES